jgi:hypothetical protein
MFNKRKNSEPNPRLFLGIALLGVLLPGLIIGALTFSTAPSRSNRDRLPANWQLTATSAARETMVAIVCPDSLKPDRCVQPPPTRTPAPTLDPWVLTATQIVAEITQTQAAREATASADTWILTVTQIVAEITQTKQAALQTPTPVPTLTAGEKDDLAARWLHELESAAGFTHPVFDEVVAALKKDLDYGHEPGWLNIAGQATRYDGMEFLVMIVPDRGYFQIRSQRILAFRVRDGVPEWLPLPMSALIQLQRGDPISFGDETDVYAGGFADRNGNGYPDIWMRTYSTGSSPMEAAALLELRPGGELIDVTPGQ